MPKAGFLNPYIINILVVSFTGLSLVSSSATAQAQALASPEYFSKPPFCRQKANRKLLKKQAYPNCANQYAVFKKGLEYAAAHQKILLVKFGADWCPWCRKLNELFNREKAKNTSGWALAQFHIIKIATSFKGKRGFHPVLTGQQLQGDLIKIGKLDPKDAEGIPYLLVINPKHPKEIQYINPDRFRRGFLGILPFWRAQNYDVRLTQKVLSQYTNKKH